MKEHNYIIHYWIDFAKTFTKGLIMGRKTDKRTRLIDAASTLIHRQGFNLTTLAHIAELATVPLGNVYYYFKTKDAIGEAVIESYFSKIRHHVAEWDALSNPRDRLIAFVKRELQQADVTARYGCQVGALCQELAKQDGQLAQSAANLLHYLLDWCEKQFTELGLNKAKAHEAALQVIASFEGFALLSCAFRDTSMINKFAAIVDNLLEKSDASSASSRTRHATKSEESTH